MNRLEESALSTERNNHLLAIPERENILYMKGIGGVMRLGLEQGNYQINPSEIKVIYGKQKPLSADALLGVALRRKKFEEENNVNFDKKKDNPITVVHTPYKDNSGKIIIERYVTDFVNWKFAQPHNDEFAERFRNSGDIHQSFFISVYPLTTDGKVIIPNRTSKRETHKGDYCFTGGLRREKDFPENQWLCETEMILNGTGNGLVEQARGIVVDQYGLGELKDTDKYVGEGKLLGILTTDPTSVIKDAGHHIDALVYMKVDSKTIIEAANQKYSNEDYRRFVKIEEKNIFNHDPKSLIKLANQAPYNLAMTQNQLIWLALANEFGDKYLENIDYLTRH